MPTGHKIGFKACLQKAGFLTYVQVSSSVSSDRLFHSNLICLTNWLKLLHAIQFLLMGQYQRYPSLDLISSQSVCVYLQQGCNNTCIVYCMQFGVLQYTNILQYCNIITGLLLYNYYFTASIPYGRKFSRELFSQIFCTPQKLSLEYFKLVLPVDFSSSCIRIVRNDFVQVLHC